MSSGSKVCKTPDHRPRWYAPDKYCNYSAFNGYRRTPSAYSYVWCPLCPPQTCCWRTNAAYVADLPAVDPGPRPACDICGGMDPDCANCELLKT